MSVTVNMKELLDAGVHFGHQTSRWNPKMRPFIFGARNGIYIVDLQKTVALAKTAFKFVASVAAAGRPVLFVGTKTQAKDVMREEAERSGSPFIVERWLGGTLTNHNTIQNCLASLEKIQHKKDTGLVDQMPKKEKAAMEKEYNRLMRNLGGIRDMKEMPGALFVVDPLKEKNAIMEARCLGIPVVAITDTNCDPDPIDYIIPGNDDALKSIRLFASLVSEAVLNGKKVFEEHTRSYTDKEKLNVPDVNQRSSIQSGARGQTTDRGGRTVDVQVRRSVTKAPEAEKAAPSPESKPEEVN